MKYLVVRRMAEDYADAIANVERQVNELCETGWKPQGGISIAIYASKGGISCSSYLAAQAMVKED